MAKVRKTVRRLSGVLLIGLLASQSTWAEEDWRTQCSSMSKLAESVMTARQQGVPMSTVIELAEGNPAIEEIIASAYNGPQLQSDRMKQLAIDEFRDGMYSGCARRHREARGG